MSTKKRILFIATEMSPYLELTEFAEIVNKLAIKCNDNGYEVRCIMPRFGVINYLVSMCLLTMMMTRCK